jgi:hypothetical protein
MGAECARSSHRSNESDPNFAILSLLFSINIGIQLIYLHNERPTKVLYICIDLSRSLVLHLNGHPIPNNSFIWPQIITLNIYLYIYY